MAPMVPNCAHQDGSVNDAYRQFYQARVNVGYMVLGAAYVHPDGRGFNRQLGIYDDKLIPGLTDLAQSLERSTRVGIQLSFKSVGRVPETFKIREIETIREAFSQAAKRAHKCGFTAIELHACHDYWLNFFLSPHFNHRKDHYGGNLENRFRLLKEVVQSIRADVGDALLLGVRLSMDEFVADGLTLEETLHVGCWLEKLGVDYISASGGIGLTQHRMSPPMEVDRGSLLYIARALKERIAIPVIGVGRLDRPQIVKQAVAGEFADLVAAARALIADPNYFIKILDGRDEDIRPCIACNFCLLCLHRSEPVRCAVNPCIGQDLHVPAPLEKPLKVMVIGGGPAGLSAAAAAARRGADVGLFEKETKLGGVVNLGKKPPFKESLQDFIDFLGGQIRDAGVSVHTGKEVTAETIRALKPDRVIIATGASDLQLEVEGVNTHPATFSALDVLKWESIPAGNYLIIGGGAVGLELAEYLAAFDCKITIIEMTDQIGRGLHATRLNLVTERLLAQGIRVLKNATLTKVENDRVEVKSTDGNQSLGPFNFIVSAVGFRNNTGLAEEISNDLPVTVIGDALQPGTIFEATRGGFDAAAGLRV